MRILKAEYPRFPESSLSSLGKSGPKARWRHVVDGQHVKIPVPIIIRTVGTHRESVGRKWKSRYKRRSCMARKPVMQGKDVTWSEEK